MKALFLAILFLSFGPEASAAICWRMATELLALNMEADEKVKLIPAKKVDNVFKGMVISHVPSYLDAEIVIESEWEIPTIARRLAMGDIDKANEFQEKLEQSFHKGKKQVSLIPFLPKPVQVRLGVKDKSACYSAAFNFHEEWKGHSEFDLNTGINADEITKRYSTIGAGEKLRYGDVIIFWGHGTFKPFHAAVYLGNGIVYHKFSPVDVFAHEFTDLGPLLAHYGSPLVGDMQREMEKNPATKHLVQNQFKSGDPFVMEFYRFDPKKELPPAKSPKKE